MSLGKVFTGGLIGAGALAGWSYINNLKKAAAELEVVPKASIQKLNWEGLTVRLDITLKNPTRGSFSIKAPFVKLRSYTDIGLQFSEKNRKCMKEKMLKQFEFSEVVKEKIVHLVLYQKQAPKVVAKKYSLPNVHIIANWIRIYKKKLEKGAIILPPMQKPKSKDTTALKKRIKLLEKSLEKANVLIYGLNAMIDYAEKELKVPIRKKPGTKQ